MLAAVLENFDVTKSEVRRAVLWVVVVILVQLEVTVDVDTTLTEGMAMLEMLEDSILDCVVTETTAFVHGVERSLSSTITFKIQ